MYTEEDFDTLYTDVKKTVTGKVDLSTVTTITKLGMQLVQTNEAWSAMKGADKKALVVAVVKAVVTDALADSKLSADTKAAITAALELAPLFIDAAVDFAKTYSTAATAPAVQGTEPIKRRCFSFC